MDVLGSQPPPRKGHLWQCWYHALEALTLLILDYFLSTLCFKSHSLGGSHLISYTNWYTVFIHISIFIHFPAKLGCVFEFFQGDAAVLGRVADWARVRRIAVRRQYCTGVLEGRWERFTLRGRSQMTSAKFSGFLPSSVDSVLYQAFSTSTSLYLQFKRTICSPNAKTQGDRFIEI